MRPPPPPARRPGSLRRLPALLAWLLVVNGAVAQGAPSLPATVRGSTVYLEAGPLALALGVVAVADGNVFTWRGGAGNTTLFSGSPDALTQAVGQGPEEVTLAAPVLRDGDAWFVPLDALPLLGVQVPDDPRRPTQLLLPDGRPLPLAYPALAEAPLGTGRVSWEPAESPLAGVRYFDGEGVSLLLVDLSLLPLAWPTLTSAVDRAVARAHAANDDHVLLLLVTALSQRPWEARLQFEQEGRRLELAPPFRLVLEQGNADGVAPSSPVVGAVLLPSSFSLYKPMTIGWAGAEAQVLFRR